MPGQDEIFDEEFHSQLQAISQFIPGLAEGFNEDTQDEYAKVFGRIQRRGSLGSDEIDMLTDLAGRRSFQNKELSDYDLGDREAGWGGAGGRLAFNSLQQERRDAYQITDRHAFMSGEGGFELLAERDEEGRITNAGNLEAYRAIRFGGIMQSMASAPQIYGPVSVQQDFNLSSYEILSRVPNGVYPSGAERPLVSRVQGRYASNKNKVEFDSVDIQQASQSIGELIRKQILKNYDASSIHSNTGTLRQAIEQAEINPTNDGKNVHVEVTLKSLVRPPQLGRGKDGTTTDKFERKVHYTAEQVTTDFYGPMVFDGRRAMMSVNYSFLRFFIPYEQVNTEYNGWHTATNVRASEPHPEVWSLSEQNLESIGEEMLVSIIRAMTIFQEPSRGE